jgi:hypothetical protein
MFKMGLMVLAKMQSVLHFSHPEFLRYLKVKKNIIVHIFMKCLLLYISTYLMNNILEISWRLDLEMCVLFLFNEILLFFTQKQIFSLLFITFANYKFTTIDQSKKKTLQNQHQAVDGPFSTTLKNTIW